jgi:Uma2 family endonuclease
MITVPIETPTAVETPELIESARAQTWVYAIPTDAPRVQGPAQGAWTYADWEQLPDDDNRYEVINGVLYVTTAPKAIHSWLGGGFQDAIGRPTKAAGLAYCFLAPFGVIMPGCDPVQPDFTIVTMERAAIITEKGVRGVPDALIEILSPGNRAHDIETKRIAYAKAGVPEFGVLDPDAREFLLYALAEPDSYGEPRIFKADEPIIFDCLPTITFTVNDLFFNTPPQLLKG